LTSHTTDMKKLHSGFSVETSSVYRVHWTFVFSHIVALTTLFSIYAIESWIIDKLVIVSHFTPVDNTKQYCYDLLKSRRSSLGDWSRLCCYNKS